MSYQLRRLLVLASLMGLIGHPRLILAEGNPFDGETIIQNDGPADGSANDPIVKSSVGDVNSIQDNSAQNDQRGRREKLEDDAIPKGNAGVAAAMAAGIALTAAGTPMIMSPILPVRLRGAELLAKAGLEFAQMAATAGTNQQNQKAADAVNKNSDGPTGSQLQSPEDAQRAAAEKVNTPELQKALGEAGINSDNFVNQLVSGQLSDAGSVLAAAGADTTGITPEMLAASAGDSNGVAPVQGISFDDSHAGPAAQAGGPGGDRGIVGQTGQAGQHETAAAAGASALEAYSQAQAMAARAMDLAHKSGTDKLLNLNEKDLVGKYLAMLTKKGSAKQALLASDMALYDLGIKRLRPKQNIFHVARKSYHDFGRWRGKRPSRFAQVAPPTPTILTVK